MSISRHSRSQSFQRRRSNSLNHNAFQATFADSSPHVFGELRIVLDPLVNQAADHQDSAIMRSSILCRERLDRIQRILSRNAGALIVREFARTYSVWEWEVEQAAALGWIKIETHKPRTGRPSRIAKIVSENTAAKLPPWRCQIEKPISIRHWRFAMLSVCTCRKGGHSLFFYLPPYTDAYLRSFPAAKKRRAAAASMSRLLHHPGVKAARKWYYAWANREIPHEETMPDTASGILQRLRELGNWRAGPRITIVQR
jgi:hypothetical protein